MSCSFLWFIITLLILVLQTSAIFVYSFSNNVTDQQALLSFKTSITLDPLGVLDSWNDSTHFCQWNGVTCSHRRQRVTSLNLTSQHLVGTLPSHTANLSFLRAIYLDDNNFHGSIPNEIGRLFRLKHLFLANNSFSGEFPANLSHCRDIRNISLGHNDLDGKLPTEFASWSKLNKFVLANNHFTGSIPSSLGNISSLRYLDLRSNNLTGGIPLEVAHLAKLEVLILGTNSLSGTVPLPLYNISSLYLISLNTNELEGTLPANLGFSLPNVQMFYARLNRFSGPLPPSITNASNLVSFEISHNSITGPIPTNWGSLPSLEWLNLGGNPLADNQQTDDMGFFDSLVNCSHLTVLNLFNNGLRGELPNSIVNLSTTIEKLFLHGNNLYGSIPHDIGKLAKMTFLSLHHNFLTGTIPVTIGELSELGYLDVGGNKISGIIPTSICNITKLVNLELHDNMLQGNIPSGLFDISTLQGLSLFRNRLSGVIPGQTTSLSSQFVYLHLDQNLFTGTLPSNFGNLKQLVQLNVTNNKLIGDIPATLGDCVMLEGLMMGGNHFQGKIPSSFKALKSLVLLDLSNNNMSGSIPNFFDGLHLIRFLNLSYNKFEGEVPKEGLFSNVTAFSVVGNLWLCGGIHSLQLPACPVKNLKHKKKTFPMKFILILVLLPLGTLLGCLAVIFYRHRKSEQMTDVVKILQDHTYPRLSYQDLLLATNEFSPNNLIGRGRYSSVYRGVLESLEHAVAVKVLSVEVRGANKSFLAECEMLRNIRHRNLIKIITACSSTDFKGNDFKALVFEFMVNDSLDNWLHSSPSSLGDERNLTLLQRLNISIDVALGVDYLHHHSHTSIIHCDIKPSNILLDNEFVAHVSDFGLARFSFANTCDMNQTQTNSTGVRGTVGYVPPEYGMGGDISIEGDVYSYGILLLEMFSGKRPTCSSIVMENGNNLHGYVKKALPQRVMDIVDPRMVLDQDDPYLTKNSHSRAITEVCLTLIFEVGILCSVEMPKKRIDISLALKQLHVARDKLLQHRQVVA